MQSGGKTKVSITVGDLCETCGKTCKRKKTFFLLFFQSENRKLDGGEASVHFDTTKSQVQHHGSPRAKQNI